jgi:hypothetical protein
MPTEPEPHDLTVCVVAADDDEHLPRMIDALRRQNTAGDVFDVVVVDASADGRWARLATEEAPAVRVERLATDASRADRLNAAWQAATGTGVAFLAPSLTPSPLWVEAISRALQRGRRLVHASLLPSTETVGQSGPLSYRLWGNRHELPIVTAAHMACLRADLAQVRGWDPVVPDDLADIDLAARLVDAGVDRHWARHAVAFFDVEPVDLADMVRARAGGLSALPVLNERPRAKARLLFGGVFFHRRNAEAMLLLAAAALAPKDRRALLLAAPWLHERLCLTPPAGGRRRRWFVLPGVLAFDIYDVLLTTAGRARGAGKV